MARRRKTRSSTTEQSTEPPVDPPKPALTATPSRRQLRKRRRRRFFFVVLLGLLGLLAALPTIVANSPLRDRMLARAMPAGAGSVTTAGGTLGWTGQQTLNDVRWLDADGKPLLTAESVTLDRSLTALLTNQTDLGKIQIVRPMIYLETRPNSSNWEAALAQALPAPEEPESQQQIDLEPQRANINVEVEIVDGRLAARDVTTGEQWGVQGLNATVSADASAGAWLADGAAKVQMVTADAALASQPGDIRFRIESPTPGHQQVQLLTQRLPLEPLQPWLARSLSGSRVTGTTSADVRLSWQLATPTTNQEPSEQDQPQPAVQIETTGKLDVRDFAFKADALVGDVLQLKNASLSTQLAIAGDQISVDQLDTRGDWFSGNAQGLFNLNELRRISPSSLPTSDAKVSLNVDLSRLAQQLPRTLNLRPGVRIDQGSLATTFRSLQGNNRRRWDLRTAIKNLRGSDGTREVAWNEPVEAYAELLEPLPGQPATGVALLNRVLVRSPFATADLAAVAGGADGEFRFDFARLAEQLGQFTDLSQWQLIGTGQGTFTLRQTGETGLHATAQGDFQQIDIRHNDRLVWEDRQLHVDLQASGQHANWQPTELVKATLTLQGTDDVFKADLLQPYQLAANPAAPPTQPSRVVALQLNGSGPLQRWAGRLRPWVESIPEELAGQATLDAQLRTGDGFVQLANSKIDIRNLTGTYGAIAWNEPLAKLTGDFRWQSASGSLDSQELILSTSTIALRTRDLLVQATPEGPPTARGQIAFQTDLERLASWAGMVGQDSPWPRGIAVGRIDLNSNGDQAAAEVSVTMDRLQVVQNQQQPNGQLRPVELWREPKLVTTTRLVYTPLADRLQADALRIEGQTMQVSGMAAIDQLNASRGVRGDLSVTYEAASLDKLIAAYLGPGAKLEGANQARVQFTGSLQDQPPAEGPAMATNPAHWSQRWQVTAETGWNAANLYGLPVGQAKLYAQVDQGQLTFQPIDLAVAEGRLTAQPRVLLDPPPRILQLGKGPLVQNLAVSQEVSESLLKYAAPILTGATRAEGEFSVELDGANVPLDDPKLADLGGRLTIHQLAILPGPTTKPMVDLLRQISAFARGRPGQVQAGNGITIRQQTLDIKVQQGRVYHRGLEFLVDDVPVRSTGSVGFDETLYLDLEVPVQEKWVRGSKYFKSMAGQVIKIPVRGTLSRWKVDDKVITQLGQQALGSALEEEAGRFLQDLLKGR